MSHSPAKSAVTSLKELKEFDIHLKEKQTTISGILLDMTCYICDKGEFNSMYLQAMETVAHFIIKGRHVIHRAVNEPNKPLSNMMMDPKGEFATIALDEGHADNPCWIFHDDLICGILPPDQMEKMETVRSYYATVLKGLDRIRKEALFDDIHLYVLENSFSFTQ